MLDSDLLEELSTYSNQVGGIYTLSEDAVGLILEDVMEFFIRDPDCIYWWQSLKLTCQYHHYGAQNGLDSLMSIVCNRVQDQDLLYLVVTDDEVPPWPIFAGPIKEIVQLLQSCRFFEYFIVPKSMNWILFDTHMNELVFADRVISDLHKTPISKSNYLR
jgi:hypothetical protein